MTFHDPGQISMTFQAWKTKIRNSMTFQVFHDPYEPWAILKFLYTMNIKDLC